MIAKLVLVAALVALTFADDYKPSYGHGQGYGDHYDNIDYKFNYDVKDDQHYNYQSRDEVKNGKNVYGSYSLVEPDGRKRVVKYTADEYGFHATVDHEGDYKQSSYKPQSYSHGHQPSYKPQSYSHGHQPSYKPQSYSHGHQPSYKPQSYSHGHQPSYKPQAYSHQPAYHQPQSYSHGHQPAYQQQAYKPQAYKPAY